MKPSATYRIEQEQLDQLDKLVEYYKIESKKPNTSFNFRVSKASVLEMLIKEKYQTLRIQGKIKS